MIPHSVRRLMMCLLPASVRVMPQFATSRRGDACTTSSHRAFLSPGLSRYDVVHHNPIAVKMEALLQVLPLDREALLTPFEEMYGTFALEVRISHGLKNVSYSVPSMSSSFTFFPGSRLIPMELSIRHQKLYTLCVGVSHRSFISIFSFPSQIHR